MPWNNQQEHTLDRMSYQMGLLEPFGKPNNPPIDKPQNHRISGLENLAKRLQSSGGPRQQGRMIFDKRKSLDRALLYSYQASNIKKVSCSDDFVDDRLHPLTEYDPLSDDLARVLINPNKLKQDYDDKVISVHYEEQFHCGDVFEWLGTNTYWLIYLQDLTEKAYFRGEIRKCSYIINWVDEEGEHSTYAAVRGPVETKIDYIQKHGISVDNPNYTLNILMPKNEETINYFKRYAKFYLENDRGGIDDVCWRVEATDWISTPGILEVNAVEYYSNEFEDDVDKGLAGALTIKKIKPNTEEIEAIIEGPTFIKPKTVYTYVYTGDLVAEWTVGKRFPARIKVDAENPKKISLYWDCNVSGDFELFYGDIKKKIVVESLF